VTDERLKELKAICEAATSGPWILDETFCGAVSYGVAGVKTESNEGYQAGENWWSRDVCHSLHGLRVASDTQQADNLRFVATARTAIPELIAEIERHREGLANLQRCVCSYCGEWTTRDGMTEEEFKDAINTHILSCEKRPESRMLSALLAIIVPLGIDISDMQQGDTESLVAAVDQKWCEFTGEIERLRDENARLLREHLETLEHYTGHRRSDDTFTATSECATGLASQQAPPSGTVRPAANSESIVQESGDATV
jgi:hypothetical protein